MTQTNLEIAGSARFFSGLLVSNADGYPLGHDKNSFQFITRFEADRAKWSDLTGINLRGGQTFRISMSHDPWFRPAIEPTRLCFYILGIKDKPMTKSLYGVYHGRFIEMLLGHFDQDFGNVSATALPQRQEYVGPPR